MARIAGAHASEVGRTARWGGLGAAARPVRAMRYFRRKPASVSSLPVGSMVNSILPPWRASCESRGSAASSPRPLPERRHEIAPTG